MNMMPNSGPMAMNMMPNPGVNMGMMNPGVNMGMMNPGPMGMPPHSYMNFGQAWHPNQFSGSHPGAPSGRAAASSSEGADGSADSPDSRALMPAGHSGGNWSPNWGQSSTSGR
jgi:hypothetical protein